ncbi:MAG: TlpA disulfide reductase family protein [Wenzhouxiangellaceae bacterium]|nr:TlpA disulfide reductase family protein [Wenzhouxiangellaceae bacterium]
MSRAVLLCVAATVVGIAAGIGLARWTEAPPAAAARAPIAALGDPRPDFQLAALDGTRLRADDFAGRPLLVNFWATWCKPCVREMPLLDAFSRAQADRLSVLGIAHDRPEAAAEFAARMGVGYSNGLGGDDIDDLMRAFGNAGGLLPYTVLVDAQGRMIWNHLGELDAELLGRALARLGRG